MQLYLFHLAWISLLFVGAAHGQVPQNCTSNANCTGPCTQCCNGTCQHICTIMGGGPFCTCLGVCTSNSQCEDNNNCTVDTCDLPTGNCTHTPIPNCDPCTNSSTCPSLGICRSATCINGVCGLATNASVCAPFGSNCVTSTCNITSGQCLVAAPNNTLCQGFSAGQCVVGTCVGSPLATCAAISNTSACNDGDPCTVDTCNGTTGACTHVFDHTQPGCTRCELDTDCPSLGCLPGVCGYYGQCIHGSPNNTACPSFGCRLGLCLQSGNCSTSINATFCTPLSDCVTTTCQANGTCAATAPNNASCAFLNSECATGICASNGNPIPHCVRLLSNTSCTDFDNCTLDTCRANGTCSHAFDRNLPFCSKCLVDSDCSSAGLCRLGLCGSNGTCFQSAPNNTLCPSFGCRLGLCQADGQCSTTVNTSACPALSDCVGNVCLANGSCQIQQPNNASCTAFNAECSLGVCAGSGIPHCVRQLTPVACDDHDNCTLDTCRANGTCTHDFNADLPGCPLCNSDDDCPNQGCLPGFCAYYGFCHFGSPNNSACFSHGCRNGVCLDDGNCTTTVNASFCTPINNCIDTTCAADGTCTQLPPNNAVCAFLDNQCSTGQCDLFLGCIRQYTPSNCNDGNNCTMDVCQTDGSCTHTFNHSLPNCAVCQVDSDCPNLGICRPGVCLRGICSHATNQGACPTSLSECAPIVCNETTGTCDQQAPSDSFCTDLNVGCIFNQCTLQEGLFNCVPHLRNSLCDDHNNCTLDLCLVNGSCSNTFDPELPNCLLCYYDGECPNVGCLPGVCGANFTCTVGLPNDFACPSTGCQTGTCLTNGTCITVPDNTQCPTLLGCVMGACLANGSCGAGTPNNTLCPSTDPCFGLSVCVANVGCVNSTVPTCDLGVLVGQCAETICNRSHLPNVCNGPPAPNTRNCPLPSDCVTYSCDILSSPGGFFSTCTPHLNQSTCQLGLNACQVGTCTLDGCVTTPRVCPGTTNPCLQSICDPVSGCAIVPRPNGTVCDDGLACVTNDYCNGHGLCVGHTNVTCPPPVNPCMTSICSEACPESPCILVNAPVNTTCSVANRCQPASLCSGFGGCVSQSPTNCDDHNLCTVDTCDLALGCVHTETPLNGTACGVNVGVCRQGVAVCQPGTGLFNCVGAVSPTIPNECLANTENPVPYCNGLDDDCNGLVDECCPPPSKCINVTCPVVPCFEGFCNATSGQCIYSPLPGAPCNDGNACTYNDVCSATGECLSGAPFLCDPSPHFPCTIRRCNGTSGECDVTFATTAIPCNDHNDCTQNDACVPNQGFCQGTDVTCPTSPNPCLDAVCHVNGGCGFVVRVGQVCTDNNICNGPTDQCNVDGNCVPIPDTGLNCNDGNPCTNDTCSPTNGCIHTVTPGLPCDDTNRCTTLDVCQIDGGCKGRPFRTNLDPNPPTEYEYSSSTSYYPYGIEDLPEGCCVGDRDDVILACGHSDECTIRSCNLNTFQCEAHIRPDNTPCHVSTCNTPCTTRSCQSGVCTIQSSLDCSHTPPLGDDCIINRQCTPAVCGCTYCNVTAVDFSGTVVNDTCAGGLQGSITLSVTSACPTVFTFHWSDNVITTDPVRTGLGAGQYCVFVETAVNCESRFLCFQVASNPCVPNSVCTTAHCVPGQGCIQTSLAGCCTTDSNCTSSNLCEIGTCIVATGQCTFAPVTCPNCQVCANGQCVRDTCGEDPCAFCVPNPEKLPSPFLMPWEELSKEAQQAGYTGPSTSGGFCVDLTPFVIVVPMEPTCAGGDTGCVQVTLPAGQNLPVNFTINGESVWIRRGETVTVCGLESGFYTYTVANDGATEFEEGPFFSSLEPYSLDEEDVCLVQGGVTVPAGPQPGIASIVTNSETCDGSADGSAQVNIDGSNDPGRTFVCVWIFPSNPNTSFIADCFQTGLSAGTYTVYVQDNEGCTSTPVTFTLGIESDCNDGNLCTTDTCVFHQGCVHTPIPIDDTNPCTIDTCDPATGNITHTICSPSFTVDTTNIVDPCRISNGTATYDANPEACGGIATYHWFNVPDVNYPDESVIDITGSNVPMIGGLKAGHYALTVTNEAGCALTVNFFILDVSTGTCAECNATGVITEGNPCDNLDPCDGTTDICVNRTCVGTQNTTSVCTAIWLTAYPDVFSPNCAFAFENASNVECDSVNGSTLCFFGAGTIQSHPLCNGATGSFCDLFFPNGTNSPVPVCKGTCAVTDSV